VEGEIDTGVELLAFRLRRAAQYIAGHQAAMPRMADAQTQAVEVVLIAEPGDDVAQPVMPAMAAALLELGDAGRYVEFIMGNQDGLGGNSEKSGQCRHRLTAAVHVGGGNQQADVFVLMAKLADQAEVLTIDAEVGAFCSRQALNEKGPCVMPGLVVFGAWISQADDQLYGGHVRGPSF